MGWKIPEIKIRVPEVRVPRAPRAMTKPARVPKVPGRTATSGRLSDFDLTIFSANRKTKGITHIDVIRELLTSGGSRTQAAENLGVTPRNISYYAKNIRQSPDEQLQAYARQLGTTAVKIKNICADISPRKGITAIDMIKALIATGGNRVNAAEKLGVNNATISRRIKNIRRLPDADLQKYAGQLNTTVAQIRHICADMSSQKGITPIDVIRELFESDGSKAKAANRLGIDASGVSRYAKNIRQLSDTQLQRYADQLNTTVAKIRDICADVPSQKDITHIDVIRALIKTAGSRTKAAEKLGITQGTVSHHAKNIRQFSDAQLQICAGQLNTGIEQIRSVCADTTSHKSITAVDVINALLATGGNRTEAAGKLKINQATVSRQAKNIWQLPDVQLQKYATRLSRELGEKITVRNVLDAVSPKRESEINFERRIQIIKSLIETDGNRTTTAAKLKIITTCVSYHAKNIRQMSDEQLRPYANQLGVTVEQIRTVCADLGRTKGIARIEIIRALLESDGNRAQAAKKLGIGDSNVCVHAKNIRQLTNEQLKPCAGQLNTTVEQIRTVCANFDVTKGITHIEIIREMLAARGNKTAVAQRLKVSPGTINHHIKNIRQLPDAKLQEYAKTLGVTVDRIKEVCAPLRQAKGKLFVK